MQNRASLLLHHCLLMCPGRVKAAYVTQGPLNYAHYRRDMIGQLGRHCIAMFWWIIWNFPAIERPWAQSLLQLPETFACVTS